MVGGSRKISLRKERDCGLRGPEGVKELDGGSSMFSLNPYKTKLK